jgi:hypothetical protein
MLQGSEGVAAIANSIACDGGGQQQRQTAAAVVAVVVVAAALAAAMKTLVATAMVGVTDSINLN